MILGFTGTRQGMTWPQLSNFREVLVRLDPTTFVHGGAVGADEDAHREALSFVMAQNIEIFPGGRDREMYWRGKFPPPLVLAWYPPLLRNRRIIARCNHLVACPATEDEVLRSGTWSTVRYARKIGRPVTIITPSGKRI